MELPPSPPTRVFLRPLSIYYGKPFATEPKEEQKKDYVNSSEFLSFDSLEDRTTESMIDSFIPLRAGVQWESFGKYEKLSLITWCVPGNSTLATGEQWADPLLRVWSNGQPHSPGEWSTGVQR